MPHRPLARRTRPYSSSSVCSGERLSRVAPDSVSVWSSPYEVKAPRPLWRPIEHLTLSRPSNAAGMELSQNMV